MHIIFIAVMCTISLNAMRPGSPLMRSSHSQTSLAVLAAQQHFADRMLKSDSSSSLSSLSISSSLSQSRDGDPSTAPTQSLGHCIDAIVLSQAVGAKVKKVAHRVGLLEQQVGSLRAALQDARTVACVPPVPEVKISAPAQMQSSITQPDPAAGVGKADMVLRRENSPRDVHGSVVRSRMIVVLEPEVQRRQWWKFWPRRSRRVNPA